MYLTSNTNIHHSHLCGRRFEGAILVNIKLARIFKRILESWNLAKNGKRFAKKRRAENMRTAVNHARISHGTVRGNYSAQIPVTLHCGATAGAAV